jgi:hypothetical protein
VRLNQKFENYVILKGNGKKLKKEEVKNEAVGFFVFYCFVNHDFHLCIGHAVNGNQAAAINCQKEHRFFGDTVVFHPQPGAGS